MLPIRIHGSIPKDMEVAMDAAESAATIIRSYARKRSKLNIDYKGKNDLVTQADVESEEKIMSIIRASFPEDQFLAEESTGVKALTDARTWIIDPIDGTTNFAHGFPTYCVSIALAENKEITLGLVFEVSRGDMFVAMKGKGASLNGRKIQVSTVEEPAKGLLATGFPYRDLSLVDEYLALFKTFMKETHGVRRPGSAAYDLCCVACGRFDGFYEYGLAPWDVAAGTLIVQEAGGIVTDWRGGEHWLFGERITAANPALHTYINSSIAETISEEYLSQS